MGMSASNDNRQNAEPLYKEFFSLYGLFLLCYSVIHLKFEWNFWMEDDFAIFAKYAMGSDPLQHLHIAKLVYFTKATWMILLVWLCALHIPFRRALAISFLVYAAELLLLFPFNIYNGLNMLLAFGFVLQEVLMYFDSRKSLRLDAQTN